MSFKFRTFIFLLLSLFFLLSFTEAAASAYKKFEGSLTGNWRLNAYGYSVGSQMNFQFVKGVIYTFQSDQNGEIKTAGKSTPFAWKQKKNKLDLDINGVIWNYTIVSLTKSELIIVDKNPGTDEFKQYEANEKGLMFERKY